MNITDQIWERHPERSEESHSLHRDSSRPPQAVACEE